MKRAVFVALLGGALSGPAALVAACTQDASGPLPLDSDGDGLTDAEEMLVYGTSPLSRDTDGDGFADGVELLDLGFDPDANPTRFNPCVADLPLMAVRITSAPALFIAMTEANGRSRTFEASRGLTTIDGLTDSRSDAYGRADTLTTTLTASDSVGLTVPLDVPAPAARPSPRDASVDERDGAEADATSAGAATARADEAGAGDAGSDAPADADVAPSAQPASGASVTDTRTVARADEESTTDTATVTFTEEQMRQYQDTIARAETFGETNDVVASAGVLKILAIVSNPGHLAYRVDNLLLTALLLDVDGVARPVGNLAVDTPYQAFPTFSLTPDEQLGPLNFVRDALTLQAAADVLAHARALVVRLGAYELLRAGGEPYALDATAIAAKTADVRIDYGGRLPPERYLVATEIVPGEPGIGAGRALGSILHVPLELEDDPRAGVRSVRGVGVSVAGVPRWIVDRRARRGASALAESWDAAIAPYHLDEVRLHAGDLVVLAYVGP